MSPATQKLAAFKHKHMGKGSDRLFVPHFPHNLQAVQVMESADVNVTDSAVVDSSATKPRSLFAATAARNLSNATSGATMFQDIEKNKDSRLEEKRDVEMS
jgi:Spo12 family